MTGRFLLTVTAIFCAGFAASAQDCAENMRSFTHEAGESCIPVAPARILALRGDSVVTPLLDIGAPVIAAGMREMEDGATYVRGASDIFGQEFVDAANLANIGDPNQPDFEAIAAAEPDFIIIRTYRLDDYDKFSAIAPTVVMPANMPYLDHIAWLADAVGMSDAYEGRVAQYRARIEEAREIIGNPSEIEISRLDMWEDGLWFYPNWGAVDQVINDIGFPRPDVQGEAASNLSGYSFEHIEDFDGDVIIASRAPRFGQTIDMLSGQWDAVAPFWRNLSGVANGNLFWYERDVWVGYSFASLDEVIDGLTLITAGREFE